MCILAENLLFFLYDLTHEQETALHLSFDVLNNVFVAVHLYVLGEKIAGSPMFIWFVSYGP